MKPSIEDLTPAHEVRERFEAMCRNNHNRLTRFVRAVRRDALKGSPEWGGFSETQREEQLKLSYDDRIQAARFYHRAFYRWVSDARKGSAVSWSLYSYKLGPHSLISAPDMLFTRHPEVNDAYAHQFAFLGEEHLAVDVDYWEARSRSLNRGRTANSYGGRGAQVDEYGSFAISEKAYCKEARILSEYSGSKLMIPNDVVPTDKEILMDWCLGKGEQPASAPQASPGTRRKRDEVRSDMTRAIEVGVAAVLEGKCTSSSAKGTKRAMADAGTKPFSHAHFCEIRKAIKNNEEVKALNKRLER